MLDLSYVHGRSHFEDDGTQNYFVFQPVSQYFKAVTHICNVTGYSVEIKKIV